MKKVFIISAIAFGSLICKAADAQIGIRIGVGFAPRRVYAPVEVAQAPQYAEQNDDYYYLPEVDAYYNVYEQCYYYFDGENWVSAAYLPGEYRDYDWSNAPRYEVRAVRPYLNSDFYRNRFHGHEVMAWRSRGFERRPNDVYANRGYGNDDQHSGDRVRGGNNEQMNQREYRGRDEHFDNRRPDFQGEQPNMSGRDNRQHFDNPMNDRLQPNENENRGNQNRGDQRFDNNRQNNFQQPNQEQRRDRQNRGNQGFDNKGQNNFQQPNMEQRHDEQKRGGQGFERNNNDNNQRQNPNSGRDNQNRGTSQASHDGGGRSNQRMI